MNGSEVYPWALRELSVGEAWSHLGFRNQQPGAGSVIAVVDTGIALGQQEFWPGFIVSKGVEPYAYWAVPYLNGNDFCDHGSRMASFAAAPENGTMTVGIAKFANIRSTRIGDGVIHLNFNPQDDAHRQSIGDEIYRAAANAHVVTLAWGMTPFASTYIHDKIAAAHRDTQAVILAAAGTDLPAHVAPFPASMEVETEGISAVAPSRTDANSFELLPWVPLTLNAPYPHFPVLYGRVVDYVGLENFDEQANPAVSLQNGAFVTFGGSSVATSQLAGLFALARSSMVAAGRPVDRESLRSRMQTYIRKQDAVPQEPFPSGRSNSIGYGLPYAPAVVGAAMFAEIVGPTEISVDQFEMRARVVGDGPFTYQWNAPCGWGGAGQCDSPSVFRFYNYTESQTFSVTITEVATGRVFTPPSVTVNPGHRHSRTLFSTTMESAWATFFVGQRIDRVVDEGLQLPSGCLVTAVRGQVYESTGGQLVPDGYPSPSADLTTHGFQIARHQYSQTDPDHPDSRYLGADLHMWHDGLSAIRVRPVYVISEPDGVDCKTINLQETP